MLVIVESTFALLAAGLAGRCKFIWYSFGRLFTNTIPNAVDHLFVAELFKNTVAPDQEEVEVVLKCEHPDFWLANYNINIASILCHLSFDVPKCPRDGQPSREDSHWTLNIKIFLVWRGSSPREGLRSINLTSSIVNTLAL
jgi:hypothetical protein